MTQPQPRNPLHGITLEQLLVDLVERVGWEATPHVWRMLAPKSRRSSSTSSRLRTGLGAAQNGDFKFESCGHEKSASAVIYGRIIGKISVDHRDVCLEQIRRGMAWHYKQYARDQPPGDRGAYAEAEVAARTARVGLWRDVAPVAPWEWRHKK